PLFPYAAMLTAQYLTRDIMARKKSVLIAQFAFMHVFFVIQVFALIKAFPPGNILVPAIPVVGLGLIWFVFLQRKADAVRIVLITTITAIAFNVFLSLHFYPEILKYQSGSQAGRMIASDPQGKDRTTFVYPGPVYSLDFYAGKYLPILPTASIASLPSGSRVYTTPEGVDEIQALSGNQYDTVKVFDHFHITMLNWDFVMKETRPSTLKKRYLLEKR